MKLVTMNIGTNDQIHYNAGMALPEPTSDALAASHTLQQLIIHEIEQQGGWISFAQYMSLALYAPLHGYYSGGAIKLGKEGDFTTSPEITPLFGTTLAQPVAAMLAQTSPQIIEFGAGSGKLACDLLNELDRLDVIVERYSIIELSGELRARQEQTLRDFPQVEWIERLPLSFSGIVIGNEVLDAMPIHLVTKTNQGWREIGVGLSEQQFIYQEHDADTALLAQISLQIPHAESLPTGYMTEVHVQAVGFMQSLATMLYNGGKGAAIFIDYGFPAHEYYFHERSRGTLMCHYRHHAHGDPFFLPGLQDITAHVDFTALTQAAVDHGLEILGYMNQATFLLSAGIGELLLRTSPEDVMNYLPQASAVQTLLSPAEMGELFKVLVVGKSVQLPGHISQHDRSERL